MDKYEITNSGIFSSEMEAAFDKVLSKTEIPSFDEFAKEWMQMPIEERAVYVMHQDCPGLFEVIVDDRENKAEWWAVMDKYLDALGFPRMTVDLSPDDFAMYENEAATLLAVRDSIIGRQN